MQARMKRTLGGERGREGEGEIRDVSVVSGGVVGLGSDVGGEATVRESVCESSLRRVL